MGALYKTRLIDDSGKLLAVLENSTGEREHRRFNQAGEVQFSLPADDPKAVLLGIATRFEIWRKDQRITSGRITRRDVSRSPWTAFGLTNESLLAGIQTPGNVEINGSVSLLSDSSDLAHVFEALTYDYKVQTLNRSFNDNHLVDHTDADTISFELEDQIALKKDAQNTYPVINLGDQAGRVSVQFSVPEGYELFRLRWSQQVAETNEIVFRYRTSIDGGSNWTAWSNWAGQGDSQETSAAQGHPLTHPVGTDTIQIQFQLLNSDTSTVTEGYDDSGDPIVIYGTTPILEAVELVCRQEAVLRSVKPHDVDWPSVATVNVTDTQLHYHNGLQAMVEIAERFCYEFYVDDDLRLHLGKQLGVDRSDKVIFRAGHNMNIVQLEDNRHGMCNILTCLGAGDGLDQLCTIVTNHESVEEYGPHPDKQEWKDIETLAELETKGREVVGTGLADSGERGAPKQTFRIQGVRDDLPTFYLGDTVRIIMPKDGVDTTGRILEVTRGPSEKGDAVDIMINRTRESAVDRIVQAIERIPVAKPAESRKPSPPTNVRATGGYRRIAVQWQARAGVVSRVYHSVTKDGPYRIAYQGPDRKYIHEPVEIGETHHYKVSVVVDGVESDLIGPVKATVPGVPSGDLDQAPPGLVVWDTCDFVTDITLRWFPAARAAGYEIRTEDANWGETAGRVWTGNATELHLAPTARSHTYYIRAISVAGVYSQAPASVTVQNSAPSTPAPPTVTEFFSALWIQLQPVADTDVLGYTLYATPVDEAGTPIGDTQVTPYQGAAPQRITYPATSGSRYRLEVAAYDVIGEGGKSAPIYAATKFIEGTDVPEGIIGKSKLTEALQQDIDAGVGAADAVNGLDDRLGAAETELASIDGRVTANTTNIQTNAQEIATKASQQDLDAVEGRVSTAETAITQNAQAIALKASQEDVDTLEGRVDNAEAELDVQAGQIAQKAEASEVTALESRVTTAEQTIDAHDGAISSVVSEVASIDGRVDQTESAVMQLGNQYVVKIQTQTGDVKTISGFGLANGEGGESEFTVMADRFRIWGAGASKPVFAVDTTTNKVYILGDLIGLGTIKAEHLESTTLKTLLLEAQLATIDEADVLRIRTDKITVGPETTFEEGYDPSEKETPTGAQAKADAAENNAKAYTDERISIIDPTVWVVGTTGSQGPFVKNGENAENVIELGVGPHGNQIPLWKCVPDAVSGPDGGWNISGLDIDQNKLYRFLVFFKRTGSMDGTTYLGTNGVANLSNGQYNGNPYFWSGDPPQLDRWYLIVGYVHPKQYNGTTHYGGVYDVVTGEKVASCTDFKWLDGYTTATHRAYLYYCTNTNVRQYFALPRVDIVDGSEPSIRSLLVGLNADEHPITAADGQVEITSGGIRIVNGSLIFVSGTFTRDASSGRDLIAGVSRDITTDIDGSKSVAGPVTITAADGMKVWKGMLNVWSDTGSQRLIENGRILNEAIVGIDAGKISSGTVPFARLPGHLLRSAPGIGSPTVYWGAWEGTLAGYATAQITFATAMPYKPLVFFEPLAYGTNDWSYGYDGDIHPVYISTTGFRVHNRTSDQRTFHIIWIALCASGSPGSGSCDSCETNCMDSCQTTCQTSCETSGCEVTCESSCEVDPCQISCQSACESSCQNDCMITCQDIGAYIGP